MSKKYNYLKKCETVANDFIGNQGYFTMNQIIKIYNFPTVMPTTSKVIGVLSFGGGLYGDVDSSGVLTNGDVHDYWTSLGILPAHFPQVIIVPLFDAINDPNNGATVENTIDIETIGAVYKSSKLTIILYIVPNTTLFSSVVSYALNTPVSVGSVSYIPTTLSISWVCQKFKPIMMIVFKPMNYFPKLVSQYALRQVIMVQVMVYQVIMLISHHHLPMSLHAVERHWFVLIIYIMTLVKSPFLRSF